MKSLFAFAFIFMATTASAGVKPFPKVGETLEGSPSCKITDICGNLVRYECGKHEPAYTIKDWSTGKIMSYCFFSTPTNPMTNCHDKQPGIGWTCKDK